MYYHTKFFGLNIDIKDETIVAIDFCSMPPEAGDMSDSSLCKEIIIQLDEYFQGMREDFDLPFVLKGTPFQIAVWQALGAIPFGRTVSYSDIAVAIGKPQAVRAVGRAIGANPLPVIIPCHRVIGKQGAMVGFRGGLDVKRDLLELEAKAISG